MMASQNSHTRCDTARVWDAVTGQERFRLIHGGDGWDARWNGDESYILTGRAKGLMLMVLSLRLPIRADTSSLFRMLLAPNTNVNGQRLWRRTFGFTCPQGFNFFLVCHPYQWTPPSRGLNQIEVGSWGLFSSI